MWRRSRWTLDLTIWISDFEIVLQKYSYGNSWHRNPQDNCTHIALNLWIPKVDIEIYFSKSTHNFRNFISIGEATHHVDCVIHHGRTSITSRVLHGSAWDPWWETWIKYLHTRHHIRSIKTSYCISDRNLERERCLIKIYWQPLQAFNIYIYIRRERERCSSSQRKRCQSKSPTVDFL